jgi:hypothetical protein
MDKSTCHIAKYILGNKGITCLKCTLPKCTEDVTGWKRYALSACYDILDYYKEIDNGGHVEKFQLKYHKQILLTWKSRRHGHLKLFNEYGINS